MIKRYNTRGNVTYHGTTVREQQNRQFSDPRLVSDGFGGAYDFIREIKIQDAAAIRTAERGRQMSVESVQAEIAENDFAIEEATTGLKLLTVERARISRDPYAHTKRDEIDEARQAVVDAQTLLSSLNLASRQLKLDLQAAFSAERVAKQQARIQYAAERLAGTKEMIHSVAVDYLALCELSGRKQNGINLQNVKYLSRLAEMEQEIRGE